uniref:Uncharacterized protein n=1 Tax=Romanomermis culicivorax TaxID=13658 RepID=A0A915JEW9_ROMCU
MCCSNNEGISGYCLSQSMSASSALIPACLVNDAQDCGGGILQLIVTIFRITFHGDRSRKLAYLLATSWYGKYENY